MIDLWIPGIPKGQPRPQVCRNGHVYTPDSADEWKSRIVFELDRWCKRFPIEAASNDSGAMQVEMTFHMPRPKHPKPHQRGKWCPTKPDMDNLEKAVLDACTKAGIWVDDNCVCRIVSEKRYTDGETGMQLTVSELS